MQEPGNYQKASIEKRAFWKCPLKEPLLEVKFCITNVSLCADKILMATVSIDTGDC